MVLFQTAMSTFLKVLWHLSEIFHISSDSMGMLFNQLCLTSIVVFQVEIYGEYFMTTWTNTCIFIYTHEGISIFKYCDTCYGSVLIHLAFLFTAPLETLCL